LPPTTALSICKLYAPFSSAGKDLDPVEPRDVENGLEGVGRYVLEPSGKRRND